MPGTGALRRSSGPARKQAIVGKSRVEANRLQRPASVFLAVVISGCMFSDLHGKESLTKANGKLGGCQFPWQYQLFRVWDVFFKLIGCYKMAPTLIHNRPGPVHCDNGLSMSVTSEQRAGPAIPTRRSSDL